MNLFAEIRALVVAEVEALVAEDVLRGGLDLSQVAVEPPRDQGHGEMASNAALVLAKRAGMGSRAIADALAVRLVADPRVAGADVAGPGFLNLRLEPAAWHGVVRDVLLQGTGYGRSTMGAGRRVSVEVVSANPTGLMDVVQARGVVVSDVLAALLAFAGYEVTREVCLNDGGGRGDVLARSAYQRYRAAHGQSREIAEGLDPGDDLIPVGEALKAKFGESLLEQPESVWLTDVRVFATDMMLAVIREDLAVLGVEMDVCASENAVNGTGPIEAAMARLKALGLIYLGVLEPPEGKAPEDWETREQTLFRSTALGDDQDRPVRKPDGSWTCLALDIAHQFNKVQRGFDVLINLVGPDHSGYDKRLRAAVSALSDGRATLDMKPVQAVKLLRGGQTVSLSNRAGTAVSLRDLIKEVGPDAFRFVMLTRRCDVALDFDLDKVREQSKDNPVFHVQYASTRVNGLLRKAREDGLEVSDASLSTANLAHLRHEAELHVIRKLGEWPRLVEIAAKGHEPHRVAAYLHDLASDFHGLWTKGDDDDSLRFIQKDTAKSLAKIALARAVGVVICAGLGILGVTPAEEMR